MTESGKDGKYWYRYLSGPESDITLASTIRQDFPTLESGAPQVKYLISTLQSLDASLDVISERVKNNDRAQEYRIHGNYLFSSNGNTTMVAEMYTQSIAYALPDSRELALAYGNRSAVSFKAGAYEDCLLDIERSLDNDYPEEMRAKLHARSVRCLVALKKPQTEIEKALQDTREALLKMDQKASGRDLVEKTLSDKNHMAPTTSTKKKLNRLKPTVEDDSCDMRGATGITVQYSKKYGRHIIATRDIRPGEIIAVIDAYANARSPDKCYRECAQCTKGTAVGIPCDHCVHVIYCSTSCRNKAWNDYHEIECPILGVMLDLKITTGALLGVKITLKALQEAGNVVKLKKMLKKIDSVSDPRIKGFTGNVLDCTKYACIYSLANHAGKNRTSDNYYMSLISTFTIYYLATRTDIFGQKYNTNLQIFDKNPLLVFLGGLIIRNCEIVRITGLGSDDTKANEHDLHLAPFTALCNHSCNPNVAFLGNYKSIVFTLQPIKAGEQIWDNYQFLHYSRVPKAQRQELLETYYHFSCDCVACLKDWPMLDKLPKATDIPGIPLTMPTLMLQAQRAFMQRSVSVGLGGNLFDTKDELVQLLEVLYPHAYPCQEIMTYQKWLMITYGESLDPF